MSEPFRDRTEGAIARRQDLLRKRRDEFVMMPHAIRRVVVERAARRAASLAMICTGGAMLVVAMSPKLTQLLARGLPGINPAVISTFVGGAWILGLVAYAISRGRAEHRFAVEMSKTVLPGRDLDDDLERLAHEQPDKVARRMAHRIEVASAALPVAAAGLVVPATLVYVAHAIWARGWPATAGYEADLAAGAVPLAIAGLAGLVAALFTTRKSLRSPRVTAPALGMFAVTAGIALFAFVEHRLAPLWISSTVSILSGTLALVNWRLARERVAIEADDPAAGSELWTLRGFLASCKRGALAFGARVPRRVAVMAAVVSVIFVSGVMTYRRSVHSAANDRAAFAHAKHAAQPIRVSHSEGSRASSYEMAPSGDGRIRITATFVDGKPINVLEGLSGMTTLPPNWTAHVTVRLENDGLPAPVSVDPFPGDPAIAPIHMGAEVTEQRFSTSVCDEREQDLGLSLVPDAGWPQGTFTATFIVEPTLELSSCK